MTQQNKRPLQMSGKTVDDAVQRALRELKLTRSQVEVTVLMEGRTGIFGVGATPATVRVTPLGSASESTAPSEQKPLLQIDDYADYEEVGRRDGRRDDRREAPRPARRPYRPSTTRSERGDRSDRDDHRDRNDGGDRRGERDGRGRGGRDRGPAAPSIKPFELLADPEFEAEDDPTEHAVKVLTDLIHLIGIDADISSREPLSPMDGLDHARAVLDVKPINQDDDLGRLIGWRGENLAALQYTVNLIVNRSLEGRHAFTVDVDGYKRRREETLNNLAARIAEQVRESQDAVDLEPMSAAERRIIHIALADDPDVFTESEGEGDARHVQIVYGEDEGEDEEE